jgi:hypothetical protein
MKVTVKYLMALFVAGVMISSCKKAVDLDPSHTINGDNFFKTVDEYDFALTGAYRNIRAANSIYAGVNGGSVWLAGPDIAADNFYGGPNNLGNLNTIFRWNYTADGAVPRNAWNAAYLAIQSANLAMRGIDRFAATEPLTVNRIEGQARTLRAHMHFELFRWWASDYDRNSTALAVPYVEVFDIEQMPARPTVKQFYDKMEADLKTARVMLNNTDRSIQSTSSTAGTERAYVDKIVVDALLARMYLYANELDSAIKYSTLAINARRLSTLEEFPLIWEDATTAGVIWSIKYQAGNAALAREIYQVSGDQTSWAPTDGLLNLYTGDDIRAEVYWEDVNGSTVLGKYFAKSTAAGNPDGVVDFKAYRTAEQYLIRAEAYARQDMDALALADLTALRAARNAPIGSESGDALDAAIQVERRKELVVEGHRFFDLKRTTRTVVRSQECASWCTLLPTHRGWSFPIPQTEMLANENMEQNPGY